MKWNITGWYSEVKFGQKSLKQGFKWNTLIFFFCQVFSETRATILAAFHVILGIKLETLRLYSLKHEGLRPPVSMNPSQLGPRIQWNHRGFQVLTQKNTWNRQNCRASFTATWQQQKNERFPFKTLWNFFF